MKIHINEDPQYRETEITINCSRLNPDIERLITVLRVLDFKLTGKKDGQIFILDAAKVLYIDTVDKKTFFYTRNDVYETDLRLYELEEQLEAMDFLRANKSCIINLRQIASIKPDIDGKLLVTMSNNEKLFVSRQYSSSIKTRLGVR